MITVSSFSDSMLIEELRKRGYDLIHKESLISAEDLLDKHGYFRSPWYADEIQTALFEHEESVLHGANITLTLEQYKKIHEFIAEGGSETNITAWKEINSFVKENLKITLDL